MKEISLGMRLHDYLVESKTGPCDNLHDASGNLIYLQKSALMIRRTDMLVQIYITSYMLLLFNSLMWGSLRLALTKIIYCLHNGYYAPLVSIQYY